MAYLKNRRPDRWRDTHRIEHTSSPYDHIESAEELRALLQAQARKLGLLDHSVLDITPITRPKPGPAVTHCNGMITNRPPWFASSASGRPICNR
jgi:hypothetical protein